MNKFLAGLSFILILASCSNAPETETGEIRTLQLLKTAFDSTNKPKRFIDARNLISRQQIDAANTPVLFVKLASGQNGTLTPYPGHGVGRTWLGADGAIITLENGILKATRGMGDDLMGGYTSMPLWAEISQSASYKKVVAHLDGNNQILATEFQCKINKKTESIFDFKFEDFEVINYDPHPHIKGKVSV